ncbi:DUF3054 domain-containing protein [Xylanimonas oleitrophica]|uniref:DUF3054 domain-containing protein n=1 Tax=Xylanimonas oleitrophica TaxID=2607479 RepID=A0A2W5WUJ7_9MICO|nr:DUF3054 domain-containing protein [Xylanimonas oleitrophica]PZR55159.1 DUF3054 domain-containing protein [Xylanimonas oleitrophica]
MTKVSVWAALACDVLVVLVFTAVGSASHASLEHGVAHVVLLGVSFLLALGVGWAAARAWRAPAQPWPTGVAVWFATVVLGIWFRALLVPGAGVAVSFVLVTALFLGATMLGWRTVDTLVRRRAAQH